MVKLEQSSFLFLGPQTYLKENALNRLRDKLRDDPSSQLESKVFYGSDSTSKDILDYACQPSFFSQSKLVVIKDFFEMAKDDRAAIIEYLKKPFKSTYMVIETEDDSLPDDFKEVRQNVKALAFGDLNDQEMSDWITKFVSAKGKRIENSAVDILKELQGKNLLAISQELEKLVAFVGERASITVDDVEALVGKSVVESAFDLGWAIGERDIALAMKIVSDILQSGKRSYEVIGLLSWHFNRLMKAKLLEDKGQNRYSISSALRIARRFQDQFFRQMRSFSLEQIRSKMDLLLKADLDIKRTKLDPNLILELTVIRLSLG